MSQTLIIIKFSAPFFLLLLFLASCKTRKPPWSGPWITCRMCNPANFYPLECAFICVAKSTISPLINPWTPSLGGLWNFSVIKWNQNNVFTSIHFIRLISQLNHDKIWTLQTIIITLNVLSHLLIYSSWGWIRERIYTFGSLVIWFGLLSYCKSLNRPKGKGKGKGGGSESSKQTFTACVKEKYKSHENRELRATVYYWVIKESCF